MPVSHLEKSLPTDLKISNRVSILSVFRDNAALTINDVSNQTGISRQTVTKSVQFFSEKGLLVTIGKGSSSDIGGKRPDVFALDTRLFFICISLWPGMIAVSLVDIQKKLIDKTVLRQEIPDDLNVLFDCLSDEIGRIIRKNRFRMKDLVAVSMSTSGTVDYSSKRLKYSAMLPNWGDNVPLETYLRRCIGDKPIVFIEKANKMTGRALLMSDELQFKRVLSFITTWGPSACLIDHGTILDGSSSLIGEIGHVVLEASDSERCICGNYGCFERLVGKSRVRRIIQEKREKYPDSALFAPETGDVEFSDIFAAADGGDALAREMCQYLARYFSLLLKNISLVFDPDMVVFQGIYANSGTYFKDCLLEKLDSFRYYPNGRSFEIYFDQRDILDLDIMGAAHSLQSMFFSKMDLYMD